MKYTAILALVLASASQASASLRGFETLGVANGFKCMFEGFDDKDKCADAVNDDGNPCSFCTVESDDGQDGPGLCVDPTVAPTMSAMNPALKCTNIDTELESSKLQDYHDFKCSIKGFTDPDKCSHMMTDDKKHHCEYCTMNGPFGEQGICVSPAHARKLKEYSDQIDCQKGGEEEDIAVETLDVEDSNPIKDCNLSGTDVQTCLDPSKVNGSECIWCDAMIGGFCFPASWKDKASHFLECKGTGDMFGDVVEKGLDMVAAE